MSGPQCASLIRIGKSKFGYVYTYMGSFTYQCERGSDWKVGNEVLWLMLERGHWYAFDAPKESVPTSVNHEKVRFVSTGADAHIPGWHPWTMTMSNDAVGDFKTTLIED